MSARTVYEMKMNVPTNVLYLDCIIFRSGSNLASFAGMQSDLSSFRPTGRGKDAGLQSVMPKSRSSFRMVFSEDRWTDEKILPHESVTPSSCCGTPKIFKLKYTRRLSTKASRTSLVDAAI